MANLNSVIHKLLKCITCEQNVINAFSKVGNILFRNCLFSCFILSLMWKQVKLLISPPHPHPRMQCKLFLITPKVKFNRMERNAIFLWIKAGHSICTISSEMKPQLEPVLVLNLWKGRTSRWLTRKGAITQWYSLGFVYRISQCQSQAFPDRVDGTSYLKPSRAAASLCRWMDPCLTQCKTAACISYYLVSYKITINMKYFIF